MSEELQPPESPPPAPPAPEDDFPEVRRRLWDLEWRLRRESGTLTEKLADVFKVVMQAPSWGGEALAESLTPLLADFRRRLQALESRASEGSAAHDPAYLALTERVEILERLVEEGVAAQRAELARLQARLDGFEQRLVSVESWSERLAALEAAAERARQAEERLAQAEQAISWLGQKAGETDAAMEKKAQDLRRSIRSQEIAINGFAERLTEAEESVASSAATVKASAETVDGLAERTQRSEATVEENAKRLGRLEEAAERLETALESASGDLGIRVGGLEEVLERAQRDLAQKVPLAQFTSASLTMASQQAAIRDLKAQLAGLGASAAGAAADAGASGGLTADQAQALWDNLGQLETRVSDLLPEFDRLAREIQESHKGTKAMMANWMELEGRMHFFAEKRQIDVLGADLDQRLGELERATAALQEGLQGIADVLSGAAEG